MTDEEAKNQLATMRAAIDQAIASAAELAPWLYAIFSESVKAGFTPDQAMQLTIEQMRITLTLPPTPEP